MATQLDSNVKDDLKTQFVTREGTYRLLTLPEYSRPNRVGYTNNQNSPQVRVSIVTLPTTIPTDTHNGTNHGSHNNNNNSSNCCTNHNNNSQTQRYCINGNNRSTTNTTNGSANSNIHNNFSRSDPSGNDALDSVIVGHHSSIEPNVHNQSTFITPTTVDARLGTGISMHTITNGSGDSAGNNTDQNGLSNINQYGGDRICFNFGRELYVYSFRGVKKGAELSKPIDKKFYKGTNPSCHDFNATTATASGAPLLVGFTTGQIQLVSPQLGPRELRKLYNEERLIDKTKVTCLKWLPNSPNLFLASHASGHLYLYNESLPCITATPNYQPYKVGDGYSILTCKSKISRNPLYKWVFTTENCCINEFCFSPCGSHLAIVSQDGFLRVFHYDTMELLGIARSYFGGFLCVCWSPDGKYIVVGGEDDLVTVWSFHERRVVARGQGHRSWVSVVAFDPYTTSYTSWDGGDFSDDENQMGDYGRFATTMCDSTAAASINGFDQMGASTAIANEKNSTAIQSKQQQQHNRPHSTSFRSDGSSSLTNDRLTISYRLGSVSQDTQLCLWDITEDVLRHPLPLRQRINSANYNDSSFTNGTIDNDDINFIQPTAMSDVTGNFPAQQYCSNSPTINANSKSYIRKTKDMTSSDIEHNSNSDAPNEFYPENCTVSSQSSNANTPCDDANINLSMHQTIGKSHKGAGNGSGSTLKFPNCISATKSDSIDGNLNCNTHIKNHYYSSSTSSTSGYNSKNSDNNSGNGSGNGSGSGSSTSGILGFNTLSQKFSNFNFLHNSEKKGNSLNLEKNHNSGGGSVTIQTRHNRKGLNLLKSYSNQQQLTNHHQNCGNMVATENNSKDVHTFGSLKLGKSSGHHFSMKSIVGTGTVAPVTTTTTVITSMSSNTTHTSSPLRTMITTYDPLKLIGTPACPRFDECPILEPLVCKKIAHERLTALIFREDCFLTACQDGFIYTWARPGYVTNITQHITTNQLAPSGGTVT